MSTAREPGRGEGLRAARPGRQGVARVGAPPVPERAPTRRGGRTTLLLVAVLYAALLPSTLDLFEGEGSQVVVAGLLALAAGSAAGYRAPGRPASSYATWAAAAGVAGWLGTLLYATWQYPGAPLFGGVWFVRFALVGALLFTGGAIVGDLVARQRFSLTSGVLATALSAAGVLVSVFQLLS